MMPESPRIRRRLQVSASAAGAAGFNVGTAPDALDGGAQSRRRAVRRDRRRPNTPAAISSNPAAKVASHGADPAGAGGAIPPKPVAAPPIGASALPAASVRVSIFSPEELSSTTMV